MFDDARQVDGAALVDEELGAPKDFRLRLCEKKNRNKIDLN